MFALAPSRATRRRLSRARRVRRAADYRCAVGPAVRPCRSAASGVVLVDGDTLAACPSHLPRRPTYSTRTPARRDPDGWARTLLAAMRRDRETDATSDHAA